LHGFYERGEVCGTPGREGFFVRVAEDIEVEGEAVAFGADGADIAIVGCAMRELNEEAVESREESFEFFHVAVTDCEVAHCHAVLVTETVPGYA